MLADAIGQGLLAYMIDMARLETPGATAKR
jgi:hypothetical protein